MQLCFILSYSLLPSMSRSSSRHPLPLLRLLSQVCYHPGLWASAAAVPHPLWLPPQVAPDSAGSATIQRRQRHHRGPAEKSSAAQGVCGSQILSVHAMFHPRHPLILLWLCKMFCNCRICWTTGSHSSRGFKIWTRAAQTWSPSSSTSPLLRPKLVRENGWRQSQTCPPILPLSLM